VGFIGFIFQGSLSKDSCEILLQRGTREADAPGGFNFCRDVRLKVAGLAPFSRDLVVEFAKAVRCEILNIKVPLKVLNCIFMYSSINCLLVLKTISREN
jgi:hypothetical protein